MTAMRNKAIDVTGGKPISGGDVVNFLVAFTTSMEERGASPLFRPGHRTRPNPLVS
jgi:hypothetical protein